VIWLWQTAWRNRQRLSLDLVFVAFCGFAFIKAIQTTADVQWPYDLDQFRDIGMAQAVLDHRYGTDHLYLGETVWFNPLVSVVIAALSRAADVSPVVVITHAGPCLNVFAPLAFYFLVAYLFDRWVALVAAVAFLFAPIGDAPSWVAATYSPWLLTQNCVQTFFYLTLAAYLKALGSNRRPWFVLVGLLLGITFLGHTAPAIILGILMVIGTFKCCIQQAKNGRLSAAGLREVSNLVVILSVAFVVSVPFTFSILGRYHLAIVNHAPNNWKYPLLLASNFSAFVWDNISWFTAFALLGLFLLPTEEPGRHRKMLLLSWLAVCCAALAINFLQQLLPPKLQLAIVPAHHFLFYLRAIEHLLFGLGVVFGCRLLAAKVVPRFFPTLAIEENRMPTIAATLIIVAMISFLVFALPAYRTRFDFTNARSQAISFQERKAYLDAYHWILTNTKPVDVFLSLAADFDLSIVGPADRKVVVTCQPEFSNPYVDWKSRADIASQIVDKLASAAPDALATLVANHVDYIITSPLEQFDQSPFLSKVFAEDDVVIYKARSN